jgi:tripartite-type tricarboxylate transporter receptor subunit TctC
MHIACISNSISRRRIRAMAAKVIMTRLLGLVLAVTMGNLPAAAVAQTAYPNRAIRIIVPVPPGPTADLLPRIIADRLTARWGQPVIVENRPGATLNLGAEVVAKAAPDGYTLLAAPPPPLAINQSLFPRLGFDPAAFVPVSVMAQAPNVLMVHPKIPAASLPELIAYAKANPGKLTYASSGAGSTPHLSMELLRSLTGIDLVHVPYKGLGPAMTDLLGGHVDLMLDNLGNAVGPVKAGRLKALGVGGATRVEALPDVPAVAEMFPGFLSVTWFAIVAPPQTPREIAAKLSSAIAAIVKRSDVSARFAEQFSTPVAGTPAETEAFIRAERERWHKVIVAAGIKPE